MNFKSLSPLLLMQGFAMHFFSQAMYVALIGEHPVCMLLLWEKIVGALDEFESLSIAKFSVVHVAIIQTNQGANLLFFVQQFLFL